MCLSIVEHQEQQQLLQQEVEEMSTTGPNQSFMNPSQPSGLSLSLTVPVSGPAAGAAQQPAGRGMGGEEVRAGSSEASTTKSSKDTTPLPHFMLPLVEASKKWIKDQKTIREENSQQRFSMQPILEVESEAEELKTVLQKLDVDLQRNLKAVELLKKETACLVSDAETAYRIVKSDTPSTPSSYTLSQNQYMNPSTHKYFAHSVDQFEEQMRVYSNQITDLEVHLENMNKPYVAEELMTIIRKQHETLIALAADIYAVHDQVAKLDQGREREKGGLGVRGSLEAPSSFGRGVEKSPGQSAGLLGPNPFSSSAVTGDRTSGAVIQDPSRLQHQQPQQLPTGSMFSSPTPSQGTPFNVASPQQFSYTPSSSQGTRAKRYNP